MSESDFLGKVCDTDYLLTIWVCCFVVSIVLLLFSCPYIRPVDRSCCMCGNGFIVADVVRILADIFLIVVLGFNAAGSGQYGTRMALSILSIITTVMFTVVRDVYLALLSSGMVSITKRSKKCMQFFELVEMASGILVFMLFIVCMCADVDCRPWFLPPNVFAWIFYSVVLLFKIIDEIPDLHAISLVFAKVFEFSISWIVVIALIATNAAAFSEGMTCEGDPDCTKPNGWTSNNVASAVLLALLVSISFGMGSLEYQRLVQFSKQTSREVRPVPGSHDLATQNDSIDKV
eukprot:CAMPEP_0184692044 /NCGR_PEP_ID=MMETSP0313-20130426/681_1 /TAXON_ID=2792 /ORGANISM="Porphyridium aerugineum, Strain SAG 1380-2" /LENGTH=289 /DNA_ID=CAMNT_0027149841 /DNA_START=480 /DNA_END=1349 /DNA_ORIENTATION=-